MRLPDNFSLSGPSSPPPPERQAQEAMLDALGSAPEEVLFDGRIHRFRVGKDKGTQKTGWYIFFEGRVPAGSFGDWRRDVTRKWRADAAGNLSAEDRAAIEESYRKAREAREAETRERHRRAAQACRQIWDGAPEADGRHTYLACKGVRSHGLRVTGDGRLIMPIYVNGELASLQYIDANGNKEYHGGGEVKGGYFRIPGDTATRYIVEGYATGASVHEATGAEVWVALNAGNLAEAAGYVRAQAGPGAQIVIVGDNDESGVGQARATEAAGSIGASVIIPPKAGDANDYAAAGGDLKKLLSPAKRWIRPFSEFKKQPAPIRWLVKNWIQAGGLHMFFGPSGVGKSFTVIDMAAAIACPAMKTWHGAAVKHGAVVYLAGEGYLGLKQRFVGWAAHRGVEDLDIFLSEEGRDLNTPDGLADTIGEIRSLGAEPVMIVIDTLHRFMNGDENKAVDVKTMLDACAALQREFGAAVCLVHHTGVAQDAQDRARGSSAWRGAMDIELKIKGDGDTYLTLSQTKNKDAERQKPIDFEMRKVGVPGWFDEDGEPVTTKVLTEPDAVALEAREPRLTRPQALAMQAFETACRTAGTLDRRGEFAGVEREAWREAFFEMSPAPNANSKRVSFHKAVRALLDLELVRHIEEGDLFRPAGSLAPVLEKCFSMDLKKGVLDPDRGHYHYHYQTEISDSKGFVR